MVLRKSKDPKASPLQALQLLCEILRKATPYWGCKLQQVPDLGGVGGETDSSCIPETVQALGCLASDLFNVLLNCRTSDSKKFECLDTLDTSIIQIENWLTFILIFSWLIFCLLSITLVPTAQHWRRGGLVVSALDFRSGGRWFESGLCRSCRFLRQEALFYIVSLHLGV